MIWIILLIIYIISFLVTAGLVLLIKNVGIDYILSLLSSEERELAYKHGVHKINKALNILPFIPVVNTFILYKVITN